MVATIANVHCNPLWEFPSIMSLSVFTIVSLLSIDCVKHLVACISLHVVSGLVEITNSESDSGLILLLSVICTLVCDSSWSCPSPSPCGQWWRPCSRLCLHGPRLSPGSETQSPSYTGPQAAKTIIKFNWTSSGSLLHRPGTLSRPRSPQTLQTVSRDASLACRKQMA